MVKLVMGQKGSGKTKQLFDLLAEAMKQESGNIVFIDKDKKLIHDIPHTVRLIHCNDYGISTNLQFKGFISGIHAGNYDITHVFIDNFYKMLDDTSNEAVERVLTWIANLGERENVSFTLSATADVEALTDGIKKYII